MYIYVDGMNLQNCWSCRFCEASGPNSRVSSPLLWALHKLEPSLQTGRRSPPPRTWSPPLSSHRNRTVHGRSPPRPHIPQAWRMAPRSWSRDAGNVLLQPFQLMLIEKSNVNNIAGKDDY